MAVEHARTHALSKPWGVSDLRPWSDARHHGETIGEIWYERPGEAPANSSLLLKLLFTSQPLSIQVHPDDVYAQSIGLTNGKTEAWYVLSATPEAQVALGLKQRMTPQELREAVDDGSISNLVVWRTASAGDVIFVPAGTIHAIGAGLVIAELQQRSDATFRMFDHGRQRELHVQNAVAVADTGPAGFRVPSSRLTNERTLLVSNPLFVLEKLDLPPNSSWYLGADRETWLLVLGGGARTGSFGVAAGDAVFLESDRVDIDVGSAGLAGLLAYTGIGLAPDLQRRLGQPDASEAGWTHEVALPASLTQAMAEPARGCIGTIQ
jgi:mannose-6-phosphate isomerase